MNLQNYFIEAAFVNTSLMNGYSLTSGSIYGEQVYFLLSNSNITDSSTDLNQGLGILYITGVEGSKSYLQNFSCLNNKAMSGSCIYAIDIEVEMVDCVFTNNKASKFSFIGIIFSTLKSSLTFKRNKFEPIKLNYFYFVLCVNNMNNLNGMHTVFVSVVGTS